MTRAADLAKLIAGGGSITVSDNSENLKLITTDADASVGPTLRMDRQSASAADSDLLGKINFVGHNDAGTPEDIGYAGITAIISDASDGTEDGKLAINTMVAGTERSRIFVDAGETVLNEDSIDLDFRVESNGNANMLFVNAGDDKIGIGTASPAEILHLDTGGSTTTIQIDSDTESSITFNDHGGSAKQYKIGTNITDNNGQFEIRDVTAGVSRMRITTGGLLTVPGIYGDTTSSAADVQVDSGGTLRRSTSSRRYKNTINDATHGLVDLLKLRSVTFKGNNDGDTVFGGLIAEEVHDAGLTEFVKYNEDNQPDGLAYGNMVSVCIKAIQELSAKNDALEVEVTKLKG